MSYALSFAPEFFGSDTCEPSDTPTSVYQALVSLTDDEWADLAREVFHCPPDYLDVESVLQRILETDTCENLDPPVRVFVDSAGFFSVLVFEKEEP